MSAVIVPDHNLQLPFQLLQPYLTCYLATTFSCPFFFYTGLPPYAAVRIACVRRMMDYMLANALQQCLLHALAQLLGLLSGTFGLEQSQLHAESLQRLPSTISSVASLQSGQPQPVLSWQTGPAGAQPLPSIDAKTGMPVAQLQQSRRSTGTASIPTNMGAMQPWVDMTLLLSSSGDDLVFRPPVADLVRHFDNVLRDLPNTIAVVQRLLTHPDLEVNACSTRHTNACVCHASTCKIGTRFGFSTAAVTHSSKSKA